MKFGILTYILVCFFLISHAQPTDRVKQLVDNENVDWNLVFEDNFDGTTLNAANWYPYYCGGHQGNGLRRPEAVTVANGVLTITAQMKSGTLVSGAVGNCKNYTYGKYEFRVRASADSSGVTSAVVLTWPQSDVWPDDGENDIFETHDSGNPYRNYFKTNILSGAPKNSWSGVRHNFDAKEWHVVAMEWMKNYIKIYVDGELKWTLSDSTLIADKPHHLCIQLDAFKPTMTKVSQMYIDWVKIYQPVVSEVACKDTLISDFENNYDQSSASYTVWSPSTNVTPVVVDNPYKNGLNVSDKVLRVAGTSTANWEGLYSGGAPLLLKINSNSAEGYRYLHCKMYKSESSSMLVTLKRASDNAERMPLQKVIPVNLNQWDTITVDLLNNTDVSWGIQEGEVYSKISIQPSKNNGGSYTFYLDDIYFSNSPDARSCSTLTTIDSNVSLEKYKISVSRLNRNSVRIQTPQYSKDLAIGIYNIQGQLLKRINRVDSESFDIDLPSSGLYILHAKSQQVTTAVKF